MPHTDDDTVLADAIFDLITTNKVALALDDVFYGNQTMIPRASAAVVTAQGKRRVLAGVSANGGRTENALLVSIALHWSKIGDEDTQRRAADAKGTQLETLLHADTTMGGIIIHGFVSDVDRGETTLANGSQFRSVLMAYTGTTKTYLTP